MNQPLKQFGERQGNESLTTVAAGETLRPLRDRIVVKPVEWKPSAILEVVHDVRPVRGQVLAVGPGRFQKRYRKNEQGQINWVGDTDRWEAMEVKVGDIVELGGLELKGYMFPTLLSAEHGEVMIIQQADVCGICTE